MSPELHISSLVVHAMPEVLSFTRAWTLVRFVDGGILTRTACRKCGGHFVVHAHDLHDRFVCGLCDVPSRAGKTRDASASGRSTAAAGVEPSLH